MNSSSLSPHLAFFPEFKWGPSVLLSGTPAQLKALTSRLKEFVASPSAEWPIHEHAVVSQRLPARLFASRSGTSSDTGFRWRCSPAELPTILAALEALTTSGSGHQYFELAGSTVQLVVSASEYPDSWWQANA